MTLTDEDRALIESVTGTRIDEHVKVLMCTVEDLAALLSAARTQSQGEGWEPIETAPRDGAKVLVWGATIGDQIASAKDAPRHEPHEWACGWDFPTGATHWMPLPAPPASQTQPRETPADPDHMNLRGTCEDPRLKQAGYIVCGSNADREWHWKPPGGAWRDGHRSEEAAVNAALKHLAASQTQEG